MDSPQRRVAATDFTSTPLAKDDAEQKILGVLDEMNQSQRRGTMSVPQEDGRLLRLLAESIGARHVVELGTAHGYSGIWFCLALRTIGGRLTTYEIDAPRAAAARENFTRAGVSSPFTLVEGDAHQKVGNLKEPVDLVFIDARMADPGYIKAITTNPHLESLFLNLGGSGISVTLKKR